MRETRTQPRKSSETGAPVCLLLLTGTPREILARIVPGDPLGLRDRTAERVRERSLLIDVDRAVLRAFALCASAAVAWRGRPPLERWLEERVDEAIDEVLEEEDGRLSDQDPATPDPAAGALPCDPFTLLAAPLGLDPAAMRSACARFNRLADADREVFFALVVEGASLDSVCGERRACAPELARLARHALDVLRGASRAPSVPRTSVLS